MCVSRVKIHKPQPPILDQQYQKWPKMFIFAVKMANYNVILTECADNK